MQRQLAGIEQLPGTYPFTLERSHRGLRLNRFLHKLVQPAWRERFRREQQALFEESGLSEQEQSLVRDLDWRGLIQYGASFFLLEKLGAVVGVSNLHIYAAMRGQSLEAFQKTRNQQVLYSVAGKQDT
jgi:gallate dioxygenase